MHVSIWKNIYNVCWVKNRQEKSHYKQGILLFICIENWGLLECVCCITWLWELTFSSCHVVTELKFSGLVLVPWPRSTSVLSYVYLYSLLKNLPSNKIIQTNLLKMLSLQMTHFRPHCSRTILKSLKGCGACWFYIDSHSLALAWTGYVQSTWLWQKSWHSYFFPSFLRKPIRLF